MSQPKRPKHTRCFVCRQAGHNKLTCPVRNGFPDVSIPITKALFFIYALVDPKADKQYKFIGKTKTGTIRPRDHVYDVKRGRNSKRDRWIRSLFTENRNYKVVVLEETTKEKLKERERWWILKTLTEGHPLTNNFRHLNNESIKILISNMDASQKLGCITGGASLGIIKG